MGLRGLRLEPTRDFRAHAVRPRQHRLESVTQGDELAAVAATVRRAIEDYRFPRAPRLDPLRSAGEA